MKYMFLGFFINEFKTIFKSLNEKYKILIIAVFFILWLWIKKFSLVIIITIILTLIIIWREKNIVNREFRTNIFKQIKRLDDENSELFLTNNPWSEGFLIYPTDEKVKKWREIKKRLQSNNLKILSLIDQVYNFIRKEDLKLINIYKKHLIEYNEFSEGKFLSEYTTYPIEIRKLIKKYSGR